MQLSLQENSDDGQLRIFYCFLFEIKLQTFDAGFDIIIALMCVQESFDMCQCRNIHTIYIVTACYPHCAN